MKTFRVIIPICFLAVSLLAACNTATSTPEAATSTPETADQPVEAVTGTQARTGVVSETMNSGGYTYVMVDDGNEEFWAAAPEFIVTVGESVTVPPGMPMQNYHSSTMDRTFDVLYFVESIVAGSGSAAGDTPASLPPGHPATTPVPDSGVDFGDITVPDDGLTVSQIFARKDELNGKEISVKGKVVKFSAAIMGTNWVHIQDGTGEDGTNDLTVTTAATVTIGDTVVIKGIVSIDQDIGSGYFYPVLIENAQITVE